MSVAFKPDTEELATTQADVSVLVSVDTRENWPREGSNARPPTPPEEGKPISTSETKPQLTYADRVIVVHGGREAPKLTADGSLTVYKSAGPNWKNIHIQ